MVGSSEQTQAWQSEFGTEYTDRNLMTVEEMDAQYLRNFGVSRSVINEQFLGHLDREMRILEVGSNIGLQLLFLQRMGFTNLYGIEISPYAVELAKSTTKNLNIIQGNALDIPFKDGFFDLVFTSGVLIHICPEDISTVMWEIYRCSSHYIWGYEYYAKERTQVNYRQAKETTDLLWKADYCRLFCEQFADLRIVRKKLYRYSDNDNRDAFYLLKKKDGDT